jgi:two-component system NtrC family sensor kinase
LLETATLSPRAREDLGKIRRAAERCSRIVKDLLSFAREYRPERSLIQVNDLIEQTVAMRSYQLRVQNIHVVQAYEPELPLVSGDPHRLQEVFLNLLVNAEQSMTESRGRGTLRVRTSLRTEEPAPLPVGQPPALDVPSPAVRIEFEDDGAGIPADVMEHIFDPFFTTREVGQGTGLGLSICYGIVGEHYGRIWAEDLGHGKGARFIVELPVPSGRDAVPAPEEEAGLHQASMAVAQGKRILVVDDEELVAHLLSRILERMGCHVTLAYSGQEALTLLSESEYDTIITDLKMPGMSGQELYSRLQSIDPGLIERVIFTTGDVITAGTADFIEQSGRPSIPKPFTSVQVAIALKELLEVRADSGGDEQVHES